MLTENPLRANMQSHHGDFAIRVMTPVVSEANTCRSPPTLVISRAFSEPEFQHAKQARFAAKTPQTVRNDFSWPTRPRSEVEQRFNLLSQEHRTVQQPIRPARLDFSALQEPRRERATTVPQTRCRVGSAPRPARCTSEEAPCSASSPVQKRWFHHLNETQWTVLLLVCVVLSITALAFKLPPAESGVQGT
eukprot:INCI11155.1.p1 GENE.INCI11155.1~~INCI11155.1.p1  ORF type:complete len:191 (+),score=14.45 INCI11155.1:281-853(+)